MSDKNSRSLAMAVLALAIVGLGVGFAAFQSTLTISSSATVTPSATTFTSNLGFDTTAANSSCTKVGAAANYNKGTVGATTITGASASFTEPGQSVTCTYVVNNTSPYLAYLTNVTFGNGTTDKITCTKTDSTATDDLVTAACGAITVTVQVGGNSFGASGATSATVTKTANNSLAISNGSHTLAATNGTETVYVKIDYAANSARADGAFSVAIPQIGLTYSTIQ